MNTVQIFSKSHKVNVFLYPIVFELCCNQCVCLYYYPSLV